MAKDAFNVVKLQTETDFSIISENIDVYPKDYSFPIKTGDTFPDAKLKYRADVTKTNQLLYDSKYQDIFKQYLNDFNRPDMLFTGTTFRSICAELPYFKTTVNAYVGLICSNEPIININDNDVAKSIKYTGIINNSNIQEVIADSIKSSFLQPATLYIVKKNKLGENIIKNVPAKNFIVYSDPEDLSTIYSYLTFNVNKESGTIEFIEYIYNGVINKHLFEYDGSKVGKKLAEDTIDEYFGVKLDEAPCVLIPNNINRLGDSYGTDKFRDFASSVLAVIRAYANTLKMGDRNTQMALQAPDGVIQRNGSIGSIAVNRGVIPYADTQDKNAIPDVKYIKPELSSEVQASLDLYKKAIDTLASASSLSKLFYDFEKAGSNNLSGEALKTMLIPTTMTAKLMIKERKNKYVSLLSKILKLNNEDVDKYNISITFRDMIEESLDVREAYVTNRINNGTMSKADGIVELDHVSRVEAYNIIRRMNNETNIVADIDNINDSIEDTNSVVDNKPVEFINLDTSNNANSDKDSGGGADMYYEDVPYLSSHISGTGR
jgi:hypothetical protein